MFTIEVGLKENNKKRRYLLIGIVLLLLMVLGVGTYLLIDRGVFNPKAEYVVEVEYTNKAKEVYEVRNYTDIGRIILYKDGKEQEILSKYPKKGVPYMDIPKVEGTYDVESKGEEVATYTYNSSLEESSKYINYLESKGYEQALKVKTTEFVEIYMTKEKEIRRIIIFNSRLMVGKLMTDNLPTYAQYIEKYKKE